MSLIELLPTVDILISTIGDRINRVSEILLPPTDGVRYVISHQIGETSHQTDGTVVIPDLLSSRDDVVVYPIAGRGLCRNRNNAMAHATADLWVLADDDVRLSQEFIDNLRTLAAQHPTVDIFALQALTPEGTPLHYYPEFSFSYPKMPRGFYFNSMGLVLRRRNYPDFDVRFGLGAERLHMGEEDVFLHQCHRLGFRITYFPQPLLVTPATTTSSRYAVDPSLQEARGAMLTLLHGRFWAMLRIISTAVKMRHQLPMLSHAVHMLSGMKYILNNPKEH